MQRMSFFSVTEKLLAETRHQLLSYYEFLFTVTTTLHTVCFEARVECKMVVCGI
jgi:hypothetical protein